MRGGSRTNVESYGFGEAYRQTARSSLATSAGRVLDRYLNVLPTITIREGYRIKVYLTNDLELPIASVRSSTSPTSRSQLIRRPPSTH